MKIVGEGITRTLVIGPNGDERANLCTSGKNASAIVLIPHNSNGVAVLLLLDAFGNILTYAFSRVAPDAADARESFFRNYTDLDLEETLQ